VATLSYAADLGLGQPMAHCMRQTVVALRLSDLLGASDPEREATYYLGLLMNVYCHADAAEQARWFGDDISFKGDGFQMLEMSTAQMISFILRRVASHGSGPARAKGLAAFAISGQKQVMTFLTTHSTLGAQFAERIGLTDEACLAIRQGYEQWDGKGYPERLSGEQISLPARLVHFAAPIEVYSRRRGSTPRGLLPERIGAPSSTQRLRTCSASTRPKSCRTSKRPRTGMPFWTPNRDFRAGSPGRSWTTSWWPWPTSSI
jgi:hypothetical protein